MGTFLKSWRETGIAEGGYVNDPSDSGGETNWGITKVVARADGYEGPMKDLTKERASEIAKRKYWDTLSLDQVASMDPDLAAEIFDTGFNMGQNRAATFLQRCLNVLNRKQKDYPDVKVDGDIGLATLGSLASLYKARGMKGRVVMMLAMNALQGNAYIELAERREKDERFLFGWFWHRVKI